MVPVNIPEIGDGIDAVVISTWFKKPGDSVTQDEEIVEVMTEKTVFSIVSPCAGILKEIVHQEGQQVKISDTIAFIQE